MKTTISEFKEKYPKLISKFERTTIHKTVWDNKLTDRFIYWLRQKITYRNLKCKDSNCPKFGQEFKSKNALGVHLNFHKSGVRERHSKEMKKRWQNPEYRERQSGENNHMFGMYGEKNPNYGKCGAETKRKIGDGNRGEKNAMFGKFGVNHPSYKYNDIGYAQIHIRAHKADPPPVDGICAYCHKVKDKFRHIKLVHSNKNHSYKLPINPDEWQWIHQSCHMKYDNKNNKK